MNKTLRDRAEGPDRCLWAVGLTRPAGLSSWLVPSPEKEENMMTQHHRRTEYPRPRRRTASRATLKQRLRYEELLPKFGRDELTDSETRELLDLELLIEGNTYD